MTNQRDSNEFLINSCQSSRSQMTVAFRLPNPANPAAQFVSKMWIAMPKAVNHIITGTLRASSQDLLALETDEGGVWQLDVGFGWHARRLLGRRVTVSGMRAGFNLLDVTKLREV